MEFIQAVVDGRVVFKDNTKTQVQKQIMNETSAEGGDCARLLSLGIMTLTKDEIVKLKKQIAETKRTLNFWKKTKPQDQFTTDLEEI